MQTFYFLSRTLLSLFSVSNFIFSIFDRKDLGLMKLISVPDESSFIVCVQKRKSSLSKGCANVIYNNFNNNLFVPRILFQPVIVRH